MISKKEVWLIAAISGVIAMALHGLTLNSPPMFDDKVQLTVGRIFSQYAVLFETPIRWLSYGSFAWTYRLLGENWLAFRLENILLHGATVLVLAYLYRRLFVKAGMAERPAGYLAAGGALIFGLHPVTVYAVSYIIQRSIVMATLFSVLSLLCVIKANETGRYRWLAGAAIAYILALSSKEYALMLPLVAGALSYWMARDGMALPLKKVYGYGVVVFGLMIAVLAAIYHEQLASPFDMASREIVKTLSETQPGMAEHIYPLSVLNESYLFFKYLLLWMLPLPAWLSVDMREAFPSSLLSWPQALGPVAYLAYGAAAFWLLRKGGRLGLAGLGMAVPWLLYPTEFAMVWVQDSFVLYRSYLWLIGLPLVLPLVYEKAGAKVTGACIVLLALLLSASSMAKLETFKNELVLWSDAIRYNEKQNPGAIGGERAYNERALLQVQAGRVDAALADYAKALQINPRDPALYSNRGALYVLLNRADLANADFDAALRIDPSHPRALYNRAAMLARMGREDMAIQEMNKILDNPDSLKAEAYWSLTPEIHATRGLLVLKMGRLEHAVADFSYALEHGMRTVGIYLNRGAAKAALGDREGAQADFSSAIALEPKAVEPYINRALVRQALGRNQEALEDADMAVSLAPMEARTHLLRAQIYVALSRVDEAMAEYNRVLEQNPNEAMALLNRGEVYLALGHKANARNDLERACKAGLKTGCDKLAAMSR